MLTQNLAEKTFPLEFRDENGIARSVRGSSGHPGKISNSVFTNHNSGGWDCRVYGRVTGARSVQF